MKQVSVVIPSFNRAHLLPQIIVTYLQPEVGELILVDDASADHTPDVAAALQKDDARIVYVRQPFNQGQQQAKNAGIKLARYPYIYFGDDDSFVLDGTIGKTLACMEESGFDVVGVKALYMLAGETSEQTIARYAKFARPVLDIDRLEPNFAADVDSPVLLPFVHSCFMARAAVAKDILFDPVYTGCAFREETDFLLRCSEAGHKVAYFSGGVQINLPRAQATGGAWSHGWYVYERSAIRNNWIFLQRHHEYLRQHWGLKTGKAALQLAFVTQRLVFVCKRLAKFLLGRG